MLALRTALVLVPALSLAFSLKAPSPVYAPTTQNPGRKYFTEEFHGFRFKPLDKFERVPMSSVGSAKGMVARFDGPEMIIKTEGGRSMLDTALEVFVMEERSFSDDEQGKSTTKALRDDVVDELIRRYSWLKNVKEKPLEDETLKISKVEARHRVFQGSLGSFEAMADIWTFRLDHADVSLVYVFGTDKAKKWLGATARSAKTFRLIDRVMPEYSEDAGGKKDYKQQLADAQAEAERTPPWRALSTPSKKFIIVTSSDNKRFLDSVIKRLEKSREVFEKDFPPPPGFDAVSIVRVCSSADEFRNYTGRGQGTAGLFYPSSAELVLYDAVDIDRNMSYAVMSHEAFHQYCHYLFRQSEAHRWFDEGHGDYYGGIDTKGSRPKITPRMPGGLDRLPVIKEMLREEKIVPLEEHINFNHPQWQSRGVPSYAQSWSLIYFLRQGTEGKVSRKVWKKEYADIIPNYVTTLSEGFQEKYAEILKRRESDAKKKRKELTPEEREVTRFDLREGDKKAIWKKAMETAWGSIDMEEFEENWLTFVDKDL